MYEKKIIFFGAKYSAYLALKELIRQGIEVELVIVKNNNEALKLIELSKKYNLKVLKVKNLKDINTFCLIKSLNISTAISVSFPLILPSKILNLFQNGIFNIHYADLPFYRGLYPTIRPIINLEKYAFLCIHKMDKGIDSGPILNKIKVKIKKNHTGWSLYEDMVTEIPNIIKLSLKKIFNKKKKFLLNDEKVSRYYNSLPEKGIINWNWDGKHILNFIRALSDKGNKGAIGKIDGKSFYVKEAKFIKKKIKNVDDESFSLDKPFCFCKDGVIIINKAFAV